MADPTRRANRPMPGDGGRVRVSVVAHRLGERDATPMNLVEIAAPEFDVEFEIAYATANNLTGKPVYRRAPPFSANLASGGRK